jgi:hypothetical protein
MPMRSSRAAVWAVSLLLLAASLARAQAPAKDEMEPRIHPSTAPAPDSTLVPKNRPGADVPTVDGRPVRWSEGTVLSVDRYRLVIGTTTEHPSRTQSYEIGKEEHADMRPDVRVLRGDRRLKLSDIRLGQTVRIATEIITLKAVEIRIVETPPRTKEASPAPVSSTPTSAGKDP